MSAPNIVIVDKDLEEIMPMFIDNRRKDLVALSEALSTKDLETIKVIAHKLAGNAGSYGFSKLSEIGADLEAETIQQNIEQITSLIDAYQTYMDTLEIRFE